MIRQGHRGKHPSGAVVTCVPLGLPIFCLGPTRSPRLWKSIYMSGLFLGHSCVQKGGPNLEPRVDPIFGPSITNMKGFQKWDHFRSPKMEPIFDGKSCFRVLNLLTPLALYWSYSCLQSGPQHWANGSPAMGVLGCGDEQEISNR